MGRAWRVARLNPVPHREFSRNTDISTERRVYDHWSSPPERVELPPGEVHVWRVSIPTQQERLPGWRYILSDDERRRADQFRFERDRNSYLTTRVVLRDLLARYLNNPPESFSFEVNDYGKPRLSYACNLNQIQFNVSHSQAYGLLAFGRDFPVGVDVEWIRPELHEIADYLLSPAEKDSFEQLPAAQRRASLLHVWTSKEAVIKALGKGFSIPLAAVEVAIDPDTPPSLVSLSAEVGHADDWKLYGLSVDEEYSAAVAVNVAVRHLRCWNWGGALSTT